MRYRLLGILAYLLSRCLLRTMRVEIRVESPLPEKAASIYCFWHGKQWLPVLNLREVGAKQAALVSPSKDGDIITACLRCCGFKVIRGSSRDRAAKSLAQLLRLMRQGYSIGLTPDGPRGPIYCAKPGAVYLSNKTDVPILPIGTAFSKKWRIHTAWDCYEVPKPFSKAIMYIGKPIRPQNSTQLEHALHAAEAKAGLLLASQAVSKSEAESMASSL